MTSSPILVETRDLCKSYPDTLALDRLSFSLPQGEILGLLGPNGAGKTTAIHVFLGLLSPTSGEVSVFGLSPLKHRHQIAGRLNFSSAYVTLPSNLKVMENMNVFSRIYGVPDAAEKIEDLLQMFEIDHLKSRLTGALSSGEKTRLNLCKAFLNDPPLLLLDEPTASLDPEVADRVRKTLKVIQREKKMSIIYTSHNMAEVEQLCDRLIFLNKGKAIAEGTPEAILKTFDSKTLEQVFIKVVREGNKS